MQRPVRRVKAGRWFGVCPPLRRFFTARDALLAAIAVGALLVAGCSVPTVWKLEARSPGGQYVAVARTVQNGGFGNAWIVTSVSLEQVNMPQTRMTVLSFFCKGPVPHPYTLDNKVNAGGTIDLRMHWMTPTHLEATYDGRLATLEFEAVNYHGIEISLKDLSGSCSGASKRSSADVRR